MNSDLQDHECRFIWATRGRTWGFRFLRTAGEANPLRVYEAAFDGAPGAAEVWHRSQAGVAMRFPDPQGRQDGAGRVIPHDFVLIGDWADGLSSVEEGRRRVWAEVVDEFAAVYDETDPPTSRP